MVKVNSKSQNGRSMVEMLGVLAIVGVLSVGGVYGYGVAMKKHKANEALHKASMLATSVSAYAMSNDGNLPSTITDFANLGYDTEVTDNGTKFDLKMEGVGYDVCKQMESSMGGVVRNVTCVEGSDDATITYYKNLATNDEEGKNSPTGGSEENNAGKVDTGTCSNGNVYLSYQESNHECDTATPKKGEEGMECVKNSDCGSGKYCKFLGSYDSLVMTGSVCETLDDGIEKTYTLGKNTKTLLLSGEGGLTWWAAENWCKAHHMKMVQASTMGCEATPSCGWSAYDALINARLDYYGFWTADNNGSNANYIWFSAANYDFEFNTTYRGSQLNALCEQ